MRMMQSIKDALTNVSRSKLRTLLTMLGLVVGISSVIVLVGLSEGSTREIEDEMKKLGTDILTTYLFDSSVDYNDMAEMKDTKGIAAVAPSKTVNADIGYGDHQSKRGMIEATDENYLDARKLSLNAGRNLSSIDRDNRSKVCVLGPSVAKDIFGTIDAVGKKIKLNGDEYTVVGVLKSKGEGAGMLTDDLVIIPFTLIHEFNADGKIETLYARAESDEKVALAKESLAQYLSTEKHIPEGQFSINSQDEMLTAGNSIDKTMTALMGGIAGISLIVAGIGIMNVMLVSVTERIREIGIKKALGARRLDILSQFLFEALAISIVGGACGIAIGLVFGMLANSAGLRFEASGYIILIAVSASIVVGLVFGIFPAYRASRLNPIEALRQE